MSNTGDTRGVLYPAQLPKFYRVAPEAALADRVSWFWIVHWHLAPGRVSRQELLPFPQMNLVIQQEGISLSGPATGASHRDLHGSGWALAALLRPAAIPALCSAPHQLRDREVPFHAPGLHQRIVQLATRAPQSLAHLGVQLFSECLEELLPTPRAQDLQANALLELIGNTRQLVRVEDLANQMNLSVRSLQRFALRYTGLTPLSLIRRYRLQEVAQRLREDPMLSLAQLAAELQYTDQAHLSADFRRVLGHSPGRYRQAAQGT
ncbi:helix-turn-helix domain-containing protein [Glutamicibacter sp. MNS18]|uniref:AraC family transcriptional regulator n=1 Tax=Glutamicibacter sp. MNS18 TaxID=2989817 RepID=UPI002235CE1A|nr:helix-turn-helix domain-containing protein [Glutamicibacter sp. MNS18]MCW4464166.1 helix-turn-helix domain-containing protein [Glutamicibacter sp. MNS18]